jgi:hypothetical protein
VPERHPEYVYGPLGGWFGGVAERSKAAVLKTAEGQPSASSNLAPSSNLLKTKYAFPGEMAEWLKATVC